ncbi:MAG: MOSC domain-containing protein [Acidimicrobiales bacterium]|nr:MOSC domain-containing protein [Acidimicrobiales bacterium]MCB9394530.1 MOSC domain-containing protein [Acidimicrobiaceae bacterium]
MQVAQLWQYPVKSMVGVEVASAELAAHGMVRDRGWAVRDEERGGIRGAKKIGELMRFGARYVGDGGDVEIVAPTGEVIRSADPEANEHLTAALGHPVTLWPLQPADQLDHYRRGRPDHDDPVAELRQIFGREDGEPFPDFSIFPPVIMEYESPPGTYLDAFPIMLMTTSALRSLAEALPESTIDVRRFRPNLVVDTGDAQGHPEFDWVGRQLRIGDVVLDVPSACPRCVMVTREVTPDVPADRGVLRHIVRELDQNVGVYATVATPGTVHAGDTVELI